MGKTALTLSRLRPIKCAVVIRHGEDGPTIVTTTISRKRTTSLLLSHTIQRLIRTRSAVQRDIATNDHWLRERFRTAYACPLGNRNDGHLLLLLTSAPLSPSQTNFLRTIAKILTLRLTNQKLEDQIKREAESVASLTHHLSEGMAVLTGQLLVSVWNRPLQRLTGFSPPEAIGKPITSVLVNIENPTWLTGKLEHLASHPLETMFHGEFEILSKQRQKRWVDVSGSVLRDKNQQIYQIIIIVRDITEHKLLEQRKNEFISIATHELRTPITAIKGYLSFLEKDRSSFNLKQQGYLDRVTAANDRLVRLAEDLLLSVQVEEDRLRLNLRPINLAVILSKVTRDLTAKAEHKGLQLRYTSPNFVTWVIGDEDKIQQIFENLIENAIKYTVSGSVDVWFERREIEGRPAIITNIRDSGIGISSKNYTAIFEKFRRAHNTSQIRESGAGLGLFIVKSFVEKLGGKISVSSRMGKGSTFTVRLNASEEVSNGKK
jgi:two-component system phosphate regulon sensor histidine kinase PhoR